MHQTPVNAEPSNQDFDLVHALAQIGDAIIGLVAACDDDQLRSRYHQDLSPIGWHGGHVAVVEAFWLCEILGGVPLPVRLKALYFPESSPKETRPEKLPPAAELLQMLSELHLQSMNIARAIGNADAALPTGGCALRFLIQHHWQHRETIAQIEQLQLTPLYERSRVTPAIHAVAVRLPDTPVAGGPVLIGSEAPEAFDNEQPVHPYAPASFRIARLPVSLAEFLGFLEQGGYHDARFWTAEGWSWRINTGADRPHAWQYTVTEGTPDEPVTGLSWYEATAFARYAGVRLPTEQEWEYAARTGALQHRGEVWEWCNNLFAPYAGFRAFPYPGYSTPWFDGQHRVLRGGSRHSGPWLRRESLRNFYTPDKRHIFAGLRLALDGVD